MAEQNERLFSYLYFVNKKVNGKDQAGKFETLKVRFLYTSVDQIPMGRVHLYNYAPKKFSRVLCLKNGLGKTDLEKTECPMCKTETYGTPSNKYFAFVEDLNDDGALKLLEFNWSLGKQIEEVADIKGRPLHDLVFTLSKKGQGKETTYTPLLEETTKFSVSEYFGLLGLSDYPAIVGAVGDKAPIMQLSKEQMVEFIDGKYPWSTGDGSGNSRKFTVLGATVTLRNEQTGISTPAEATVEELDELDELEEIDDTPSKESYF